MGVRPSTQLGIQQGGLFSPLWPGEPASTWKKPAAGQSNSHFPGGQGEWPPWDHQHG